MTRQLPLPVIETPRLALRRLTTDDAAAFAKALADRGNVGLSVWAAPAKGRYQVWAALGTDKCRARCSVWATGR